MRERINAAIFLHAARGSRFRLHKVAMRNTDTITVRFQIIARCFRQRNASVLATHTEFLELASLPEFQDCYVDCLTFEEEEE